MRSLQRGPDFDAIVIGAGMSGMYMLHRLRDILKMSARVFERGEEVGGTWYWNRYPGARCDSESYIYCYSFDKQLLQDWSWSGKYPEQPEILRYLQHVADRFDLRRDIQFDTDISSAVYNEAGNVWEIRTDKGERFTSHFLITAIGCISTTMRPKVNGAESFRGEIYHTGTWPHSPVDFRGKRVGVIGTGSSGVQSIPVIARDARHLYVFQRTPNFSLPARHENVDQTYLDDVKAHYDEIWARAKSSPAGYPIPYVERKAMDVSAEDRRACFERGWEKGGFDIVFNSFNDLMLDRRANDMVAEFVRERIRKLVKDPDVAECLVPVDHPFGSKRPLIDTDYFETYNRDNVTLVDIRHHPIQEIRPTGVRTEDGDYELDMIVWATGFDNMTGTFLNIDIRGRNGIALKERWKNGPKQYLGLMVNGFPNMFTITGPGSPSVIGNVPVNIEQHVEYISELIDRVRSRNIERVEVTAEAEAQWGRKVSDIANETLFVLADSWYMGANIPGKPRLCYPYIGGQNRYRKTCNEIAAKGYPGFVFS